MKKVKKLTIILTIVLISLISFIGIYVPNHNIMTNIVKDYDWGMNIEGYREVRLKVAEKEEVTSEKVEQVKQLLQTRLDELGAQDYLIKANYTTGEIVLELEETDRTDDIVGDIYIVGEFKMVDSEDTSKILMDKNDIEDVALTYSSSENGTGIYLNFEFTEEGAKKIEDLSSNQYKTIEKEESKEEEKTEEGTTTETDNIENKEEVKQPKLTLMIDDMQLISSSFNEPITEGRVQLLLNSETEDAKKIQESVNSGLGIATVLNNGPLPIKYELKGNTYVYSEITEEMKMTFVIAVTVIVLVALFILVIKYKVPAIFAGISYVGFIALYLLVLRYANVVITLEGISGIVITLIINYLLTQKLLKDETIIEAFKEMGIQLIPVLAVIVAFSFIGWTNIASFGMAMFWGIILTAVYNAIVTKNLIEK